MGVKDGQCLRCKMPLLIETKRMRPLCPDCEAEFNEKIAAGMAARGKQIKGKALVFPKKPEEDET